MPSNHLILCGPFLLLPSISLKVFSNESALCIKWPKYWSFSFSISLSNEYSGFSFRVDWFDLLSVQESLKSLLQHHSLKAPQFFGAQSSSHIRTLFMHVSKHPRAWQCRITSSKLGLVTLPFKIPSPLQADSWQQTFVAHNTYTHNLDNFHFPSDSLISLFWKMSNINTEAPKLTFYYSTGKMCVETLGISPAANLSRNSLHFHAVDEAEGFPSWKSLFQPSIWIYCCKIECDLIAGKQDEWWKHVRNFKMGMKLGIFRF